ncbi:MAG: aminoglycoside 6-adenylyltransferase [Candidatus Protochlamydia sp.]|nr:aminoglycoside 6-adenylyltransferase [Candidatus Protochlamydia sp.]
MLEKLIEWGKKEDAVRALILLGSRAGRQSVDAFSDFDISVFCDADESYTEFESWLTQFCNVLVCVKEKVVCKGKIFPSRLVIFEGGIKVDFSFLSIDVLDQIAQSRSLPEDYHLGYKILLDKDNKVSEMPPPQFEVKAIKPSEQEFHEVVKEFWFEIYHVGVYLKRGDLWSVKFRSWAAQSFLLKIIEWHAQAKNNWRSSTPPIGKRMHSWVSKDLWIDLYGIFAHFDAEDSWKALFNTMELFNRITEETAQALRFSSMDDLSKNMMDFIILLKSSTS